MCVCISGDVEDKGGGKRAWKIEEESGKGGEGVCE